jgi:hypothetical protein
VREAVQNNNFVAFFRLYHSAPLLGRALMDIVVPAVRCVRVVVAFFGGGGAASAAQRRTAGLGFAAGRCRAGGTHSQQSAAAAVAVLGRSPHLPHADCVRGCRTLT